MSMSSFTVDHDKVAALAHKFWEDEGRPEGRAEAHWLRAVEALNIPAVDTKPVKAKAATKSAPVKKAAKKA